MHALLEKSLTQSLAGARDAVARNDINALRHELHSLRGAFATIHEHAVADAVGALQALVHEGDMVSFDARLAEVERLAREALRRRATQTPSV
ncbi:Hpt domain-containing protein [Burkholderia cenocepacia]|uniref:Hpt domain-containing protein n=1 Tax=Burkholderia cenocepacia TaxID=95486 RepID=UPI001FC85F92|nr:Hpt domain-containing protein [Burkholderia cenocepacia]